MASGAWTWTLIQSRVGGGRVGFDARRRVRISRRATSGEAKISTAFPNSGSYHYYL